MSSSSLLWFRRLQPPSCVGMFRRSPGAPARWRIWRWCRPCSASSRCCSSCRRPSRWFIRRWRWCCSAPRPRIGARPLWREPRDDDRSAHAQRVSELQPNSPLAALATRARAFARSSELSLVVVAIVVGVLAGLCVTAMTFLAESAHVAIYGIALDVRLSAAAKISPFAAFLALPLGGLVLGLITSWRRAKKLPPVVDPIEANALRGGRMSMGESLLLAAQTVISNGAGASVGLESGYSQIG